VRSVETYVENSGLDAELILLVKLRVSQINGCAYCLRVHTEHARTLDESDMRLHRSMPGMSRSSIHRENALPWHGRNLLPKSRIPTPPTIFIRTRGASFPKKS